MNLLINKIKPRTIIFFCFLILTIFLCFWNLGNKVLERWDEATNAEVVYELVHSDNPFYLTLFSEPFFEKPPFWYYLTAISVKILGYNEIGLRFVSALAGLGTILLIFKITKEKINFSAGITAGLVLLCTRHLFLNDSLLFSTHNFRSADLDSLYLFFLFASFSFLWKKISTRNLIFAGICAGLSFLSKGPFSLLPIIILFLYNFTQVRKNFWKHYLNFIIPFFLTILPWHIFMTINWGNAFINTYFNYHIFLRTIQPIEDHTESIIFYIFILLNPRFFFSGLLLILSLTKLATKKYLFRNFFIFTIVSSIIIILVIVTLIQTKLSWYIFPIYPFSALAIANLWSKEFKLTKIQFITVIFINLSLFLFITEYQSILIIFITLIFLVVLFHFPNVKTLILLNIFAILPIIILNIYRL